MKVNQSLIRSLLFFVLIMAVIGGSFLLQKGGTDVQPKNENVITAEMLYGSWLEPVPGQEDQFQGFTLNEDGTASSINMATLKYHNWRLDVQKLILSFESIGSGVSFSDQMSFTIDSIESNRLYLRNGEQEMVYKRQK